MKRYSVVQRHKSRGNKTWYGRIYDTETGEVSYVSLSVDKKKDALAWRDRMITSQLNGNRDADRGVDVSEAVSGWLKSRDCCCLTVDNYSSAMSRLSRWFSENRVRALSDVTPLAVTNFVTSLDDWSASTRRKRVGIYRSWAKWVMDMYDTGWRKNPFTSVKVKGERTRPKDFWTIEQVEAIISAQEKPEVALMYAFMAFAGLRYSEFASLSMDDIFDEDGDVKKRLRLVGKGGKHAEVPICSRLREQIITTFQQTQNLQNKSQFLAFWCTAKGCKIPLLTSTNHTQNRVLKKLISENSILASFGGKVHLHRFRHSFISNLIRANACSVRCVAELARHDNVMITLNTYSHLLPSDKEQALEIFTRKDDKNQGGPD